MNLPSSFLRILFYTFLINLTSCDKDEAPSIYSSYQTKAELELPFSNSWYVVWGGRTLSENYHASLNDQRFAMDVLQIENGSTHLGNGLSNDDYYCYRDTIYAPAYGQIVEMKNTVRENIPGQTNGNELFGNYVIIDHGNDEYSVLAHMITNSIAVNVGEIVEKGQMLGLTGNSGNSTEPHLHYHLQNKPSITHGDGLPAQFLNYYANDMFVSIGEPLSSQTIRRD